ncbi:MAG TPA: G1 family glutamic endopeptidase, partial [Acidimicrobiales bacterium]|nr:G1 family glutamic endopeptidase [Acidimicrobiales bacterium]
MNSKITTPTQSDILSQQSGSQAAPRPAHHGLKVFGAVAAGLAFTAVAGLAVGAVAAAGLGHAAGADNPRSVAQSTSWNSTSDNWSGYAETTAQTGQRYTQASAEWVVPSVATLQSSNGAVGCAALWTGIGGATSKDLIQLGTSSCSNSSQTGYSAWYEILPAAETIVPSIQIEPGDRVFASLRLVSGGGAANSPEATAAYQDVVQLLQRVDPSFNSTDVIERLRQLLAEGQARYGNEPWWSTVSAELHELFGSTSSTSAQVWQLSFQVTSPDGAVQNWTKTLSYAS